MPSLNQIIHDINQSSYRLDITLLAGLIAGDHAADALETIHLYAGRRWAGWYNYPGTVTVAKKFGQMANSRLWDSMFPGSNESPAITFSLAGKSGPAYSGSYYGTKLRTTGYLGYLITEESLSTHFPCKPLTLLKMDGSEGRKTGSSAAVTIISLPPRQYKRITSGTEQKDECIPVNPKSKFDPPLAFWSIVPSLVSILACVLCFLGQDTLCASLILLGIVSSGFSSLILGTATLSIRVPVTPADSPEVDGLMFPEDGSTIVLKGEEADVNVVTKGEFELDYSAGILPHPKYHMIGLTSVFLYAQFLVQLLLIPRCSLFGQLAFLVSFVASRGYHLYVASYEREDVQLELLSRELSAQMEKWTLGTRSQMAVFVCLLLGDGREYPLKSNPDSVLLRIIPNDTSVWRYWRRKVVKELERFWDPAAPQPYAPSIKVEPASDDEVEASEYSHFTKENLGHLDDLIGDAWCVFRKYQRWRESETGIWQERDDGGAEEKLKACQLSGGSPA